MGHKDEWRDCYSSASMRCAEDRRGVGRSKSATNIMIKGFQYFSRGSSRRSSVTREGSEDRTDAYVDEVLQCESTDSEILVVEFFLLTPLHLEKCVSNVQTISCANRHINVLSSNKCPSITKMLEKWREKDVGLIFNLHCIY